MTTFAWATGTGATGAGATDNGATGMGPTDNGNSQDNRGRVLTSSTVNPVDLGIISACVALSPYPLDLDRGDADHVSTNGVGMFLAPPFRFGASRAWTFPRAPAPPETPAFPTDQAAGCSRHTAPPAPPPPVPTPPFRPRHRSGATRPLRRTKDPVDA